MARSLKGRKEGKMKGREGGKERRNEEGRENTVYSQLTGSHGDWWIPDKCM